MPNPPLTNQEFTYIESLLQEKLTSTINPEYELKIIEHVLSTIKSADLLPPSLHHLIQRLNERKNFLLRLPQNIPIL